MYYRHPVKKGLRTMRKKSVFINCMETLTANRKHSEARTLLNAGLKESAERQTAATAPAYVLTKPYVFPAVDGNMTYHTSWGSHGVKEEAETILSVLSSFLPPLHPRKNQSGATPHSVCY